LLVDDSIVRGTTSAQITTWRAKREPRKCIRLGCAPVRYPNVYGIGTAGCVELCGRPYRRRSSDIIGADWLIYQDLEDSGACVRHTNAKIEDFDTSCFSGEVRDGDVTPSIRAPAGRAIRRSQAAASRWPRSWTQSVR